MTRHAFIAALVLLAACSVARADRVVLKGGRVLEGVVGHVGEDFVEMESAGGNLRLPRTQVERVERDAAPMNALTRAGFDLHRNRPGPAAEIVERALADRGPRDMARGFCIDESRLLTEVLTAPGPEGDAWHDIITNLASDFALRTTTTLTFDTVPTSASIAARMGADLLAAPTPEIRIDTRDEHPATSVTQAAARYLLAMARVLNDAGRRVSAGEMIERLAPRDFDHAVLHEGFVQSLIVERVKYYLNHLDFAAAAALIDRAERGGAVVGPATRTLFLIRWAGYERRRGDYDAALEILRNRLHAQTPALAVDTMRSILSQARMKLAEGHEYGRAIALIEKWGEPLLGRGDTRTILADLWRDQGEYFLETDRPDDAREAFREYARLRPTANPATLFARCDFRERLIALPANDAAGAFELAQWAEQEGLISSAIEAYERAAENKQLRPLANEQMELLRDRRVLKQLETCTEWFEKGNPHRALEEIRKFEFMPVSRRLQPEIDKLRRLCHNEIARRAGLRPVTAETLFQEAQRRFYAGEVDAAEEGLRQVLRFFPETPAAERTREFLHYVETRNRINRLEGVTQKEATPGDIAEPSSALDREVTQLLGQLDIYQGPTRPIPTYPPVPIPPEETPR